MKIKKEREAIMETMLNYIGNKEGGIMLNNKPIIINKLKRGIYYTPEEKHAIVQAYLDGMKVEDIAIKYNTNGNTITRFVKEEGHVLRRVKNQLTEEEKAIAIELYEQGNSLQDISVALKKGNFLVRKVISEAGIMRPSMRPFKKDE